MTVMISSFFLKSNIFNADLKKLCKGLRIVFPACDHDVMQCEKWEGIIKCKNTLAASVKN